MKAKRILSALLAALLLAGTMTACGESQDPPREETTANQVTETEAETDLSDALPDDLDFGGQEITFISRYLEGWTSGEIAVEGLINEPVNDAIYERNKAVEDRLKIEINSIEENNSDPNLVVTKVDNAVKAGTNEYSVLAAACYVALPSTLNGNYVNLRGEGAEYLDLEQPYWAQGLNEVIEYGGTQFAVTGEALITLYRMAFVTCFNQALFDNASQPYLYDYVDNGTWTLDKQISLVPLFHQDNGNGQQDDEGDIYGFASGTMASIDPYWSSCKVDIIRKNGEGMYELVLDNDRIHGVSEKVLRLFHNTDGASRIFQSHGYGGEHDDIRDLFSEGDCAMATLHVMKLESEPMRNMKDTYGVVPMPKYDEAQDGYRTLLHDQFTVFCIPTTVQGDQLSMVCAALEAMASASYRIVKPAYYETTLRTKLAQDSKSAEMLEIIIQNVYIDAGIIYTNALPGFQDNLRILVNSKNNDAVSRFTSLSKRTKGMLRAITVKLDKLVTRG